MQNVHHAADGDPWAKNSSEDGIPYYVSRDGADTSWDHPMLGRVLSMLEDCNRIEYAAYRAATKLRMIQKRLNWDALTVYPVASIMQHHALRPGEADTLISIGKVSAVIADIFAYIAWIGAQSSGFSFDLCSELTLNVFINIFDKKRRGQVRVLSVQTFLCLLCKDRPQGKLRYLFRQVSDHNNCCSRVKLATLLKEMCAVMEYLDEGWKFGLHTVGPAVESCFSSMCPRQNHGSSGIGVGPMRRQVCFGLTEEKYLQWMAQHPQNLVWLFINHRLADSEHVVHSVQCRACRQTPIVGLCYVCLQCWNVQLCQTCFLLSHPVSGHKKSHQMEEHCAQLTYSERFSVAVNRLLSVMRLSRPCVKKGPSFLPLNSSPQVAGDLIPVLTRSEDGSSTRDGNPSPLPPPPPPPEQPRGGRRNDRGGGGGAAYALASPLPGTTCSSRSSGVVVDPDLDATRTPTSAGNWFCQSPNLLPSVTDSSATSTRSSASPAPTAAPAALRTGGGDGDDAAGAGERLDEPNVGRRKSIGINVLPVHQQELQSILWHFEEEQKQLKSVLGNLDAKADGVEARRDLEQCSSELEAQLGRLRSVLKNYMRCSVAMSDVRDVDGDGNQPASVRPNHLHLPSDLESLLPTATGASRFFPGSAVADGDTGEGGEFQPHDPFPPSSTLRTAARPPLESTAVGTPVDSRGGGGGAAAVLPYSPIGLQFAPDACNGVQHQLKHLRVSEDHQVMMIDDQLHNNLSPATGKVVFRVKKLPTSLQMRSGLNGEEDPVFNGRPRAPDEFYGFSDDELPGGTGVVTGKARFESFRPNIPNGSELTPDGNDDGGDRGEEDDPRPPPVALRRAPLAEPETLASIQGEVSRVTNSAPAPPPAPPPRDFANRDDGGGGRRTNGGIVQQLFPAISLGDISSCLLSMTQDLDVSRGSPSCLPYDQQAKRVSMINRELEGILRELDAVYPASARFSSEGN